MYILLQLLLLLATNTVVPLKSNGQGIRSTVVVSRLLFSMKRADAHSSYAVFKRGAAPPLTQMHKHN